MKIQDVLRITKLICSSAYECVRKHRASAFLAGVAILSPQSLASDNVNSTTSNQLVTICLLFCAPPALHVEFKFDYYFIQHN